MTPKHCQLPVRGRDRTQPVQGVRGGSVGNAIQRNLAAHKVNEQSNHSPQTALTEGNLGVKRYECQSPSSQEFSPQEGMYKEARKYGEDRLDMSHFHRQQLHFIYTSFDSQFTRE